MVTEECCIACPIDIHSIENISNTNGVSITKITTQLQKLVEVASSLQGSINQFKS